jgi:TetR/AcrR family transcriptional regulator
MENMFSSPGPAPSWQDRARERALAGARHRADDQLIRLLRAAQGMINEEADLTVPALVGRVGMSTKTFYRHFASRDELLLAVLEEELAIGAHLVRKAINAHREPVERMRACVLAYVALPARYNNRGVRRTWTQLSRRLIALYPDRAKQCSAPMMAAFRDGIQDLVDAGHVQLDDPALTGRSIFHLVTGLLVDATYEDGPDVYERIGREAWRFVCVGLNLSAGSGNDAADL